MRHLEIMFCLFVVIMLVSCQKKKAQYVLEAASELSAEDLRVLDSLVAVYGECPKVPEDTSQVKPQELKLYSDAFKEHRYDTLPAEKLNIKTLLWFCNDTPFGVSLGKTAKSFPYRMSFLPLYYCEGDDMELIPLNYHFEFSYLKDQERLVDLFKKYRCPEKWYIQAAHEIDQVRYITFVENQYVLRPSGGFVFFSSGDLLSEIKVFDIKSGAFVGSASVYAANSEEISYIASRQDVFNTEAQNALLWDLVNNYSKMMVKQLNTICQ